MKLKVLALALFLTGLLASYALASPGKGHGKGHGKGRHGVAAAADTTTGSTTTTGSKKVTLCHQAGHSGRYVKLSVSRNAVKAHVKHGDVMPDASGNCPASTAPTSTDETTTDQTTTDQTTTDQSTTTTGQ